VPSAERKVMSEESKTRGPKTTQHSALSTQHSARTGTVLAFDFGTKRIGVAVGDFETRIAHPLVTIAAVANRARFAAIGQLVAEWRAVLLVVGLPAHADGTEHLVGKLARRFAQRLHGRFGIRTELVDEGLTSHEAEGLLRAAGARGARLKAGLDSVAAQRILDAYFASVPRDE